MADNNRIVLAYSGGLDTSVAIPYLKDRTGKDVVAVSLDVGQGGESLETIKNRALACGAVEAYVVDARNEFANEYCMKALKANAMYEGVYPLVSAISRPLISKHLVRAAHQFGADTISHIFTTLLCLLFCIAISAQDKAADLSKLVGDWSFSAPDAPYGYQDGSFQIKQENGKLTAKVNIQGSTLEINDIKAKGDTYTSSFYVDGTPVDLTMTQKGNKLEGMADAGGMQIPVKFKKTKK